MLVRFYVCTDKRSSGDMLDTAIDVADIRVTNTFGGFTRFQGTSGWLDEGKICHEESLIYEVATEESPDIDDFASYLKGVFGQISVLVVRLPATHKLR